MPKDRPKQPAYEIFSTKRRFEQSKIVSSNGTLFQLNGEDYLRIGANADWCIMAYKPLKLTKPIKGGDAATKQYVDDNIRKQIGLILSLSSPSSNKSGHNCYCFFTV